MKGLHGLIFAYDKYPALRELTEHRSPASVPFGGRYRVIDFMLSNLVNAGVFDVGVILHGNYQSLLDHLGTGKDWDLSRIHGGLRLLPPFGTVQHRDDSTFRGKMDALYGVRSYLENIRQDHVVMTDSDLIINIPLQQVYEAHMASGADITCVCTAAPGGAVEESTYFELDQDGWITDTIFGIRTPRQYRSLDIFILSKQLLLDVVEECGGHDHYSFRNAVLQNMAGQLKIRAYVWEGYSAQIRSLAEYYERSMELLDPAIRRELFPKDRPIYTKELNVSSTYVDPDGGCVNSLVADGCTVEGTVENSILFRGVSVAKGAQVKDCILMQNAAVGRDSVLHHIIADKNVKVAERRTLIGHAKYPMAIAKNSEI